MFLCSILMPVELSLFRVANFRDSCISPPFPGHDNESFHRSALCCVFSMPCFGTVSGILSQDLHACYCQDSSLRNAIARLELCSKGGGVEVKTACHMMLVPYMPHSHFLPGWPTSQILSQTLSELRSLHFPSTDVMTTRTAACHMC
jgi:hypothetical protein